MTLRLAHWSPYRTGTLVVFAAAALVFWRTAYPTITWWDSSGYSLATATMGVTSPPGSLLLTLLGWPVAKLATGTATAHALNLFAGVIAAAAVALVYWCGVRFARLSDVAVSPKTLASGAVIGALTLAYSATLWDYAGRFTPYILTALFTGLVLLTMLRWWEDADRPASWRWLVLLGVQFGLDFSVHRTNALLIPGALVWILLRRPRALVEWQSVLGGTLGLVVGLSVQLLVIPIAVSGHSPLNFNDPSTWSRFWSYISLENLGGSFLLQLLPRKAGLWSVQTADVLRSLRDNFLPTSGVAGVLGVAPAVIVAIGFTSLWRANRRLAAAFGFVVLIQTALTVLYFNRPAEYFRSFDRHYLPICVTVSVLGVYGASVMAQRLSTSRWHLRSLGFALLALAPVAQLTTNWRARDSSNRYFTRDWGVNALRDLPANAVFFTAGDNDTYPLLYVQAVEGVRRDVAVINIGVAGMAGYAERVHRRDPTYPLSATTTVLDLLTRADVGRPVTYSITIGTPPTDWPRDKARFEGLYWRIAPAGDTASDLAIIRGRLLEKAQYRGYADRTVVIDEDSRRFAFQYYNAVAQLLAAERKGGEIDRCRADLAALFAALPPDRLGVPPDYRETLVSACGG
jgi:hypothetical protein